MRAINYSQSATSFLEQLPKGAFLTVKAGERLNTMTIGWGSIGYMWKKPVLCVMVRYSRHTYEILKEAQDFTVSLPLNDGLKKALGIAGTNSGRTMDKFKECNITPLPGKNVVSPAIAECDLIFECKIILQHSLENSQLDAEIKDKFYANDDYHVMYYGEILGCYIKD